VLRYLCERVCVIGAGKGSIGSVHVTYPPHLKEQRNSASECPLNW